MNDLTGLGHVNLCLSQSRGNYKHPSTPTLSRVQKNCSPKVKSHCVVVPGEEVVGPQSPAKNPSSSTE
jgi:hypothetical protein